MILTPEVQAEFGKAWAAMAALEGHRQGIPKLDRVTAREAIADLLGDGEWHSSDEIAEAAGIAKNNLRKYLGRLALDKRAIPLPRGGRSLEWRLRA